MQRQGLDAPVDEVFAFFADPEALEAITPDRLAFNVRAWTGDELDEGTRILYGLRLHGIPLEWVSEIQGWDPPHGFVDVQLKGPYARWEHTHRLAPRGEQTVAVDRVRYALPGGALGRLAHPLVRWDLGAIFDYRAGRLAERFGPAPLDADTGEA